VIKKIFANNIFKNILMFLLLFYYEKMKFISSSYRVIFFLSCRQKYFCPNNGVKAGNDVIDILTSEYEKYAT